MLKQFVRSKVLSFLKLDNRGWDTLQDTVIALQKRVDDLESRTKRFDKLGTVILMIENLEKRFHRMERIMSLVNDILGKKET